MKIAISSGHGLKVRGARGNPCPPQHDEVDEVRKIVNRVAGIFKAMSPPVTVAVFHDDTSTSQNQNLNTITSWHNKQSRDYDVSCHLNAFDHSAHGTEVLYVSQEALAARVSLAIANAGGFHDRGAKRNDNLAFLNSTSKPAILLECYFCDNTSDCEKADVKFEAVCQAIAEAISGQAAGAAPPPAVEKPPPQPPPTSERPTISRGDTGPDVSTVQTCLKAEPIDGDFGPITEDAVKSFQGFWQLDVDGVVGPQTWAKLEEQFKLPPYEPPAGALDKLDSQTVRKVIATAQASPVAKYAWRDRGVSPKGYVEGMAMAWTTVLRRFYAGDSSVREMAKGNTGDSDVDVLAWYADIYNDFNMDNSKPGVVTLRHLFALMWGLGMRETSGQYCCGRDMSADNVSADTAEAGLYQMSWNAKNCSSEMQKLFNLYSSIQNSWQSAEQWFKVKVTCSASNWQSYGSGAGYDYQELAKHCPQFAVETAAVGLRNLRQHWGPINRHEAELRTDVDDLLSDIQELVMPTMV